MEHWTPVLGTVALATGCGLMVAGGMHAAHRPDRVATRRGDTCRRRKEDALRSSVDQTCYAVMEDERTRERFVRELRVGAGDPLPHVGVTERVAHGDGDVRSAHETHRIGVAFLLLAAGVLYAVVGATAWWRGIRGVEWLWYRY